MSDLPLEFEHAFDLTIRVGQAVAVNAAPNGERRLIPILGGVVDGPMLKGHILPGGMDLQWLRPDGVAEISACYTLEIERGRRALLHNRGLRWGKPDVLSRLARGERVRADEYYFRGSVWLESGDSELEWVRRSVFACTGQRETKTVRVDVSKVE